MTNIPLRVSTRLLADALRLGPIEGQIIGVALNGVDGILTFTIATPAAPTNATGMEPTYTREWPSNRYFMTDPGWTFGGAK
ncbi:hypothetical protein ABH931_006094 [Streptacidiphilus sp. MAP12-33]|uniref:hypothetical protein n=1 Tax=Streptacidiphilus sp. MAP12-33 TaxID=3156266 RepID=UPI003513AF72